MSALAEWFAGQPLDQRMEAARRVAAIAHADALWRIGFSRGVADIFAAMQAGCRPRTIRTWRRRLRGVRIDQPAALHWACPRRLHNRGETK
jgi:hypothetical protein